MKGLGSRLQVEGLAFGVGGLGSRVKGLGPRLQGEGLALGVGGVVKNNIQNWVLSLELKRAV